jgi:hypothetical protein
MTESEFKKRIDKLFNPMGFTDPIVVGLFSNSSLISKFELLKIFDEAKKEIFPLPTGDIITDPKTLERHQIVLDFRDWLPFINALRRWFGDLAAAKGEQK